MMNRTKTYWMAIVLALIAGPLAAWLSSPAYAQGFSRVTGSVEDVMGKPYANLTLVFTNEVNRTFTTKTDAKGQYALTGLPSGMYKIDLKDMDKVIYQTGLIISGSSAPVLDINLKTLMGANAEAEAKRAEAEKSFQVLKGHFDAGIQATDAMKAAQAQLAKTPKDQQGPVQDQIQKNGATAVAELGAAEQMMKPEDANHVIVLGRLGEAYDAMGKWQEAADTYQKSIELKPDAASSYNNLGNDLARLGKIDEAKTAYQKYVTLDPTNAALAWRNFGIVLYQVNRMKEAIEPLQTATQLDPKNAQAWFLLGSVLVNTMEFKTVGDKLTPVIQPGTVEAYQHAIDLDPNGTWGAQSKQGLEALQAMGAAGVDTKIGSEPAQNAPAKKKK